MKAAKTEHKIINNIMISAIFILENLYESCQNRTQNYKYKSMCAIFILENLYESCQNRTQNYKYKSMFAMIEL
jgi:hypothetical protein